MIAIMARRSVSEPSFQNRQATHEELCCQLLEPPVGPPEVGSLEDLEAEVTYRSRPPELRENRPKETKSDQVSGCSSPTLLRTYPFLLPKQTLQPERPPQIPSKLPQLGLRNLRGVRGGARYTHPLASLTSTGL